MDAQRLRAPCLQQGPVGHRCREADGDTNAGAGRHGGVGGRRAWSGVRKRQRHGVGKETGRGGGSGRCSAGKAEMREVSEAVEGEGWSVEPGGARGDHGRKGFRRRRTEAMGNRSEAGTMEVRAVETADGRGGDDGGSGGRRAEGRVRAVAWQPAEGRRGFHRKMEGRWRAWRPWQRTVAVWSGGGFSVGLVTEKGLRVWEQRRGAGVGSLWVLGLKGRRDFFLTEE